MPDYKPLNANEIEVLDYQLGVHDLDRAIQWSRVRSTLDARDKSLAEAQASAAAWTHTATERGLALAEKAEECTRAIETRDIYRSRMEEVTTERTRLTHDLADAITECQRVLGDDEKVCDILAKVDPALLDYDETPECVEALAGMLSERDGAIEALQFQVAELDFQAGGVLSSMASLRRKLTEARAALRACLDSSASRSGGPCKCGACNMARAALTPVEKGGTG